MKNVIRDKNTGRYIGGKRVNKYCEFCNKQFSVNAFRGNIARFCSRICKTTSTKGIMPKGFKNIKGIRTNTGRTHFKKGQSSWNKGLHIRTNTGKTLFTSERVSGKNNFNWKGGVTSISEKLRKSIEYEELRKQCFDRDLYTCQDCGQVGGYLHMEHIKPFSLFPELRFELTNVKSLCEDCHKKTYSYLNSHMKKEDFI